MTHEEIRKAYKALQAGADASPAEFNAACRELLTHKGIKKPTPAQWLKAAKLAHVRCHRCGGTGQFVTGSVNGKLVGPGGICFRCEGKGYQTREDEARNMYYDQYAAAKAFRAMLAG